MAVKDFQLQPTHSYPHTHTTHTHSGSDGLVKVWTIRSNECAATLDGHTERVWALAVGEDGGEVVSGGGDSLVCSWKVCSYIVTSLVSCLGYRMFLRA